MSLQCETGLCYLSRELSRHPGQDVQTFFFNPCDVLVFHSQQMGILFALILNMPFFLCTSGSRRAAADQGSRSGGDHRQEETLRVVGSRHC